MPDTCTDHHRPATRVLAASQHLRSHFPANRVLLLAHSDERRHVDGPRLPFPICSGEGYLGCGQLLSVEAVQLGGGYRGLPWRR